MIERGLMVVPVVEDVGEIDARFRVIAVELERAAQRRDGAVVLTEAVLDITDAGDRFRRIRRLTNRGVEEVLRGLEEVRALAGRALAEQRTTDLQHEIDVIR